MGSIMIVMMWMIIMIRSMMHYFHQVLKLACIINLMVDFITEIKLPKKLEAIKMMTEYSTNDGILSSTNRLYPLL